MVMDLEKALGRLAGKGATTPSRCCLNSRVRLEWRHPKTNGKASNVQVTQSQGSTVRGVRRVYQRWAQHRESKQRSSHWGYGAQQFHLSLLRVGAAQPANGGFFCRQASIGTMRKPARESWPTNLSDEGSSACSFPLASKVDASGIGACERVSVVPPESALFLAPVFGRVVGPLLVQQSFAGLRGVIGGGS